MNIGIHYIKCQPRFDYYLGRRFQIYTISNQMGISRNRQYLSFNSITVLNPSIMLSYYHYILKGDVKRDFIHDWPDVLEISTLNEQLLRFSKFVRSVLT